MSGARCQYAQNSGEVCILCQAENPRSNPRTIKIQPTSIHIWPGSKLRVQVGQYSAGQSEGCVEWNRPWVRSQAFSALSDRVRVPYQTPLRSWCRDSAVQQCRAPRQYHTGPSSWLRFMRKQARLSKRLADSRGQRQKNRRQSRGRFQACLAQLKPAAPVLLPAGARCGRRGHTTSAVFHTV